MAALGCLLLELLHRAAERRILTTSWAAEDHRWRPPGRAGKDELPAGTIPHPSPHPALTINLLGPFVARRPAYDLGALTRLRSVELEILVGNHTTVTRATAAGRLAWAVRRNTGRNDDYIPSRRRWFLGQSLDGSYRFRLAQEGAAPSR